MKKLAFAVAVMSATMGSAFAHGSMRNFTETWSGIYPVDSNSGAVSACDLASLQACTNAKADCEAAGIGELTCEGANCDTIGTSNVYTQVANSYCTATVRISVNGTPPAKAPIPSVTATKSFDSAKDCEAAADVITQIAPGNDNEPVTTLLAQCKDNTLSLNLNTNVQGNVGTSSDSLLLFSRMYGSRTNCQKAKNLLLSIGGPQLSFAASTDNGLDCEYNYGHWYSPKYDFGFTALVQVSQ